MEAFEPRIVTFLCWKWGYGACDMAGTIRAQYPATLRPVRVMCTARVSADMVLRALNRGADGVIIGGWQIGECDFQHGNEYARNLVAYLQDVLETMGLERDRIKIIFVSAAEGERFRQLAVEMDTTIRKLGPSKLRKLQQEITAKQTKKAQKTPA